MKSTLALCTLLTGALSLLHRQKARRGADGQLWTELITLTFQQKQWTCWRMKAEIVTFWEKLCRWEELCPLLGALTVFKNIQHGPNDHFLQKLSSQRCCWRRQRERFTTPAWRRARLWTTRMNGMALDYVAWRIFCCRECQISPHPPPSHTHTVYNLSTAVTGKQLS